jgi:hypothetical protein
MASATLTDSIDLCWQPVVYRAAPADAEFRAIVPLIALRGSVDCERSVLRRNETAAVYGWRALWSPWTLGVGCARLVTCCPEAPRT